MSKPHCQLTSDTSLCFLISIDDYNVAKVSAVVQRALLCFMLLCIEVSVDISGAGATSLVVPSKHTVAP